MDKEGHAAAAAPETAGPPILKALEDLLVTLRKSSKDLVFYPAGHPMLTRSLERAAEQMRTAVGARAPLPLAVSRAGFSFEGQLVGKENRQLASMAAELFVRRIQKVFFAEEIGPAELAGFLRMITTDVRQLVEQGGPAKVLTAHGVGRIQVNEFDFRRVAEAASAAGAESASAGMTAVPQGAEGAAPLAGTAAGGPLSSRSAKERKEAPSKPESLPAALDSPEELGVETLIQRLEQEADSGGRAGYDWAVSRLEKAAGIAVHNDLPQELLAILGVFLRHRGTETIQASLRERAAQAVEAVAGGDTVPYLVEQLRTGPDESVETVSSVLVGLGAQTIPSLVRVLVAEDRDASRLRLVRTLALLCQVAEPELTRALQKLDRDQASRLAPILAGIGGGTGVFLLACLLRHREPRPRREAIRELGRLGEPAAHQLFMQALRDPDPTVLEVAVGLVGAAKLKAARPTLLRLAGQRVLSGKSFPVRLAAVTALGAMGDTGAIPILKGVLYTRTWFRRPAGERLRQAAALALLSMNHPEAAEMVVAGAHSRRRGVRRACTTALRMMPGKKRDPLDTRVAG